MLYAIVFFLILLLLFRYVSSLRTQELHPWLFSLAFALKAMVGCVFIYMYTDVNNIGTLTGDAGAYMEESAILNDVFYTNPIDYLKLLLGLGDQESLMQQYLQETSHWDAGTQSILGASRNTIRLQSVIQFFSGRNPYIHVLVMCALSLIGIKQLYVGLRERTQLSDLLLFGALVLFPNLLFWGSGILKEPMIILGGGLLIRGLLGKDFRPQRSVYFGLGLIILYLFKPYLLLCMMPAAVFLLFYTLMPRYKTLGSLAILGCLTIGFLTLFGGKRDHLVHLLSRKQHDFKNVAKGGLHANAGELFYFFEPEQISELTIDGDSVYITHEMDAVILMHGALPDPIPVHLTPTGEKWLIYFQNDRSAGYIEQTMIHNSFWQLVKNSPQAIVNALFRPFPTDPGGLLNYPAVLETILLYAFLIWAFIRRRTLDTTEKGIIWFIVLFALTLALLIGWVTPVLGAIVRYRIPVYLGIFIIALIIYHPKKKLT